MSLFREKTENSVEMLLIVCYNFDIGNESTFMERKATAQAPSRNQKGPGAGKERCM